MASAAQTIPEFNLVPEQYGLHNARPEAIHFYWGGMRFTLPPVDAIGPKPVLFADGAPIPGSLLLQDAYQVDVEGNIPKGGSFNWKAREAVQSVLGIEPHTQQATSSLALNGISFLPLGCSRERFQEIKRLGDIRYRESKVTWATETVQAYEVARNKAKEAGVDARPPGPEFYEAQAILQAHQKALQQRMGYEVKAVEQAVEDDELDFEMWARAYLMKKAQTIAERTGVEKAALVEEYLKDPAVSNPLRRKYSIRARGYMAPDDPELGKAEQPDSPSE